MKKTAFLIILITVIITVTLITAKADNIDYEVTASRLNIRQYPNTSCAILGSVSRGATLRGGISCNGWTPITWLGQRAYVYSAYIKPKNSNTNANNQSDLDLVARVVNAEAGSDWLSDEHQRAVASVILNRVSDSRFPNTIQGVVYQKGQYGCVGNGMINRQPSQRAIQNAKYVLDNGSTIPANVVWQAPFKQGAGVWKYIEGHYFCY